MTSSTLMTAQGPHLKYHHFGCEGFIYEVGEHAHIQSITESNIFHCRSGTDLGKVQICKDRKRIVCSIEGEVPWALEKWNFAI